MSEERKTGVIASASHVGTSKGGWKRYDVSLENGDTFRAVVPSDANMEFVIGETYSFNKGKWDSWIVDTRNAPSGGGASNSNSANGSTSGGGVWSSNDYWKGKYAYEVEHKDPRLEFQGYLKNAAEIYSACIGTVGKPVHEMEEDEADAFMRAVDVIVDSCFAKTKEVFRRVNRKSVGESDTQQDETPQEEESVLSEV